MIVNINKKMDEKLNKDEINISIEYSAYTNIDNVIEYIKNYDEKKVLVRQNNEYLQIDFQDIIAFYSDKKNIFCRTKKGEYKIRNSLRNFENLEEDFIRISKSCIINMKHLDSFDMGKTGVIIVKLDDGTEEIVIKKY